MRLGQQPVARDGDDFAFVAFMAKAEQHIDHRQP
jgi:hypothetical protein